MKNDGIEYSTREKYKMQSETVLHGLSEMALVLIERQLEPVFIKMKRENVFKPLRSFANWHTGWNKFSLEIFGQAIPKDCLVEDMSKDESEMIQDFAHWKQNLFRLNDDCLKMIANEISKQNITGNAAVINMQVTVAVIDYFYAFTIVWNCYPQNFEKSENRFNN